MEALLTTPSLLLCDTQAISGDQGRVLASSGCSYGIFGLHLRKSFGFASLPVRGKVTLGRFRSIGRETRPARSVTTRQPYRCRHASERVQSVQREMFSALSLPSIGAVTLLLWASLSSAATPQQCPPEGFDSVPDFDVLAYASAPWYVLKQVRG